MKTLQVSVNIPRKKFILFSYYQFYTKPLILLAHVVITVTLIANIILYIQGEPQPNFARNTFLVVAVTGILLPYSLYSQFIRKYKKNPLLYGKTNYEFSTSKVKMKNSDGGENSMGWEKLFKVKEYSNWILLYIDKYTAAYLPKQSFSQKEQLEQFKQLVKNKKNLKTSLQK
ncbi:MAG: YcxB family protein [Bacteroidota bacterium]